MGDDYWLAGESGLIWGCGTCRLADEFGSDDLARDKARLKHARRCTEAAERVRKEALREWNAQ